MPTVEVTIRRKSQPGHAWPDIREMNLIGELTLERALILEGGLETGGTSITFALKDGNGEYFYALTSGGIIDYLHTALKNAERDWREKP